VFSAAGEFSSMADDYIQGNYFNQLRWDFISSSKKKKRQDKFFTHITGNSVADPDPMFLGLPDSDPLVRGTDPDPSIIKQNLDSYCSVTSF
jgi:hypothetical protein